MQKTAMSFVTVSKIVDFFEEIGMLSQTGDKRDGSGGLGRKRVIYNFVENSYCAVGVQLSGGVMSAVLTNLRGNVVFEYTTEANVPFYDKNFRLAFGEVLDVMKEAAKSLGATATGVGLAVDGAINEREKTVRIRVGADEEKDFSYRPILEGLSLAADLPVVLENDVNASAFYELGETQNSDLLFISAGVGIGAGLVLNRRLYRGFNGRAGELEYMCFDTAFEKKENGVGWLESRLGLDKLPQSEYVAQSLALAIVNIISVLDIQTVVLGGQTVCGWDDGDLADVAFFIRRYSGLSPDIYLCGRENAAAVGVGLLSFENELAKIISG